VGERAHSKEAKKERWGRYKTRESTALMPVPEAPKSNEELGELSRKKD